MAAAHRLKALVSSLVRAPGGHALVAGALAACGFEPLHLWPLTLAGIGALALLISTAPTARRAAALGWLWGAGHFIVGNGWIATAFTYQAAMPVWLGWIAVVALSFYLAIYPLLAAGAAWFVRRHPLALGLGLAGAWIVSEWLRSWVFTGFAWNPLGVAMLGGPGAAGLAVTAPWIGTYGLSGLTALLGAGFALAIARTRHAPSPRLAIRLGGALVALVALMWVPSPPVGRGAVPYTLVQANIGQDVLNDPANFETQFVKTARMSPPLRSAPQRLVLWSESGTQDLLREGYPDAYYMATTYMADPALARRRIGRAIGAGSLLLTGTTEYEMQGREVVGARNAVTALGGDGMIVASYWKAHLVPYGEYLPARWLLEPLGLARLVPGDFDFWPGTGPRTLDLGRYGRAGVQVCYEIVFSGQVVDRSRRPDYLFNPSNDGWFGAWGPPQHLAQARLRAIEEGLPVLRATTNGISAVIDPYGRIERALGRNVYGRIDGIIPSALPPTLFARAGNVLPLVLAAVFLAFSLLVLRRARG